MFGIGKLKRLIGEDKRGISIFYSPFTLWGRLNSVEDILSDSIDSRWRRVSNLEWTALRRMISERYKCQDCLDGLIGEKDKHCSKCGLLYGTNNEGVPMKKKKGGKKGGY